MTASMHAACLGLLECSSSTFTQRLSGPPSCRGCFTLVPRGMCTRGVPRNWHTALVGGLSLHANKGELLMSSARQGLPQRVQGSCEPGGVCRLGRRRSAHHHSHDRERLLLLVCARVLPRHVALRATGSACIEVPSRCMPLAPYGIQQWCVCQRAHRTCPGIAIPSTHAAALNTCLLPPLLLPSLGDAVTVTGVCASWCGIEPRRHPPPLPPPLPLHPPLPLPMAAWDPAHCGQPSDRSEPH